MNRKLSSPLVAVFYLTSWVLITKGLDNDGHVIHSPKVVYKTKQGYKNIGKEMGEYKEELNKRIGSRPLNCDHQCGGCNPCHAIQVPEITEQLGLLFANYEPEGWKCKCGASFFNP